MERERWVWLRGGAHWLGGPRVRHPIGQSSVTWSLPRAWIPTCSPKLRRSGKARALCPTAFVCPGSGACGPCTWKGRLQAAWGKLEFPCCVKRLCSFFPFLHRYRKRHQFRGVPPTSQNQRSHHQWPDCET